jgi:hypothetical protein
MVHNIHDESSRYNQKVFKSIIQIFTFNCKLNVKNAKIRLIDHHMNVTYHMQILENDFYIGTLLLRL